MSWQAQTAVTYHSKQRKVEKLRLLMLLADGANAAGVIDPAPRQETLAEFLGVSPRTIRNYLDQIEADGELKQLRIGSGPGNASAYQIALPMPENGREGLEPEPEKGGNKGGKVETEPGFFATFEAFKMETKAAISALKVEINQLKVANFESKGGKVEGERWQGHSFKNADDPFDPYFDPILIQEEEGTPLPPYPAELVDEVTGDEAEELAMWQTAVELASRWAKHRGTYRRLDPQKQDDANDYFRPILGLVVECEGDGEQAWQMMKSQCERMVADGLTVVRAGPVVSQIRNEQQRALLPANAPQNGRPNSRAEEVAAAYAAKRQEYFNG